MKTNETSQPRLYNEKFNSYAIWNGSAWEDKKTGAYFYTIEKANNNGYFIETSTREKALAWWKQLSNEKQIDLQYIYRSPSRHPLNAIGLTGREIEEIWLKEIGNLKLHKGEVVDESYPKEFQDAYLKPNQKQSIDKPQSKEIKAALNIKYNQKQFKQFDESLFKAYIDKMPDSESLNMIKIIYENKLPNCKFKSHLDKWFKL